jgi:Dolichyl-phosphate-mannose-protein mannosyltransferase
MLKPQAIRLLQALPSTTTPWPRREWLLGLFVLGLIPRLVMLATRPDGLEFWEYETLATNLVSGQGYTIPRFGHVAFGFGDGNLYSFLAASVYFIAGHDPQVLAAVQAVIASLAAPVIFVIGARAFGCPVAALGAALAALHPGLLVYTLKLHPLGIDVLLLALMVFWVGRAGDGMRNGVLAGLSLGLSLMSRPTLFLAGLVTLGLRWGRSRASLASILATVAVAVMVASPWVARNWVVLGRPVFISSSLEDVWKGNSPAASGSSYLPNGRDVFSSAPPELLTRLQLASELEVNDIFGQEIIAFVTRQPGEFVALSARKFVYFWWLSPQAGLLYPSSWLAAYTLYAAVTSTFAAVGALAILRGRGNPKERSLLGTLAAISFVLAVIHALSYVEGRHRWGVEPLLLLLTARGIFAMARGLSSPAVVDHLRFVRRTSAR